MPYRYTLLDIKCDYSKYFVFRTRLFDQTPETLTSNNFLNAWLKNDMHRFALKGTIIML